MSNQTNAQKDAARRARVKKEDNRRDHLRRLSDFADGLKDVKLVDGPKRS